MMVVWLNKCLCQMELKVFVNSENVILSRSVNWLLKKIMAELIKAYHPSQRS